MKGLVQWPSKTSGIVLWAPLSLRVPWAGVVSVDAPGLRASDGDTASCEPQGDSAVTVPATWKRPPSHPGTPRRPSSGALLEDSKPGLFVPWGCRPCQSRCDPKGSDNLKVDPEVAARVDDEAVVVNGVSDRAASSCAVRGLLKLYLAASREIGSDAGLWVDESGDATVDGPIERWPAGTLCTVVLPAHDETGACRAAAWVEWHSGRVLPETPPPPRPLLDERSPQAQVLGSVLRQA